MTKTSLVQAAAAALLLTTGACGDAVTDSSYRGESLFRVQGRLTGALSTAALVSPKVGIIWATGENSGGRVAGSFTSISAKEFPARFELRLFEPPPESAYGWLFGAKSDGRGVAAGFIYAVDDVNQDGGFSVPLEGDAAIAPPDHIFGVAKGVWVYYVKAGVNVKDEDGLDMSSGYHLARVECGDDPKLVNMDDELVDVSLFAPGDSWPRGFDSGHVCIRTGEDGQGTPSRDPEGDNRIVEPCRTVAPLLSLGGTLAGTPVRWASEMLGWVWSQRSAGSHLNVGTRDATGVDLRMMWSSVIGPGQQEMVAGTVTLPAQGAFPGATICLGAGSRIFMPPDGTWPVGFELRDLKKGPDCAEPVVGELQGCWASD